MEAARNKTRIKVKLVIVILSASLRRKESRVALEEPRHQGRGS